MQRAPPAARPRRPRTQNTVTTSAVGTPASTVTTSSTRVRETTAQDPGRPAPPRGDGARKKKGKKKKGGARKSQYQIYAGVLPTSLDNIKIVSFDPAPKNPAISVCMRNGQQRLTIALELAQFQRTKGAMHIPTYTQLNTLLAGYYPHVCDAKLLIVEEQPSKNWESLRSMQHVISWFSIYVPNCCIVEISNKMRLRVFDIPSGLEKDDLKHRIILLAETITRSRGDSQPNALIHKYLNVLREQQEAGKKIRRPFRLHDQCDTIVQEEAFLRFCGLLG